MDIQLIVFDMAGTTIRDDDAVNRCLQEALAAHGVQASRDDINFVMGLPKPIAIRHVLEKSRSGQPVPGSEVNQVHDDFLRRMIHHYETDPGIAPMPGALETLAWAKAAGLKVALDTGFSRPVVNTILKRLAWDNDLLDAVVASDEVARGRPHPDLIFKAMEVSGIREARRVAKVGDTPSDLQEGTAAGCSVVVGVTNGTHTREQLTAHPHTHLISDLRELPDLIEATHLD